ncbi:MAG: hypothetical protein NT091_02195 [Candidatus Falkowbacteria bacterium]|nr:hypothetical protein [Candidatus Falkowbacteria bacterium]
MNDSNVFDVKIIEVYDNLICQMIQVSLLSDESVFPYLFSNILLNEITERDEVPSDPSLKKKYRPDYKKYYRMLPGTAGIRK